MSALLQWPVTTWRAFWRFSVSPGWTRRIGFAGLVLFVLIAIVGPLLDHYAPTQQYLANALESPSLTHPFGTDQFGRDVLSRVLSASRVDLEIGFFGVAISIVLGTVMGLLAGFFGGWLDAVIGRVIDVFAAFPYLVLVIAIVAMLGPGLRNLYIAIAVVSWISYAKFARAETLSARNREYVLAARGLGYSSPRTMFRHLLPNIFTPGLVYATSDFVLDIVAAATLGFLGLGVQPPQPEWGAMIADGQNYIFQAPWLVIFPGAVLILLGVFCSLLGDGLADYVRRVDRAS
jgi:peptide/nickel transport system permease protein